MFKNFKISAKLSMGFGAVLALFAIAVFFSWMSISAVQKDIAFLAQIAQSLRVANETSNAVSFIRSGIRDLHYYEKDEDAVKLQGYLSEVKGKVDDMKRLYAEEPRMDTLARGSDLEVTVRNTGDNLENYVSMLHAKQTSIKTVDEGIVSMQKLFQEIVDNPPELPRDALSYDVTDLESAEVIVEDDDNSQ